MSTQTQQKKYAEDFSMEDVNGKHADCKRKARYRIQETRNMSQEIEATVADCRSGDGSETKEKLEEFIGKYQTLKEVLINLESGSTAMQSSTLGGINIIAEYEALASSIIHIMKQAEDNANNKGGDDCCAEGGLAVAVPECVAELAENMRSRCGSGESEETRRAEMRETALKFSDLLEIVNREIHLLDKVTVYFQSFFSMLEGLCTVKKIGKLKADKVMLAARDLDRSCSAYISLVNEAT